MSRIDRPQVKLSQRAVARIGPLAAVYAVALAGLERLLPIRPSFVTLEVIGGVLLVGLPVMGLAREAAEAGATVSWESYEAMVASGFVAAGVPILIWQALEYAPRLMARRSEVTAEVR